MFCGGLKRGSRWRREVQSTPISGTSSRTRGRDRHVEAGVADEAKLESEDGGRIGIQKSKGDITICIASEDF